VLQVQKRNASIVPFDKNKIVIAIQKAMRSPAGEYVELQAEEIADEIELLLKKERSGSDTTTDIKTIESIVYNKLIEYDNIQTAKAYEGYRAIHEFRREHNTSDDNIMAIVHNDNDDLRDDNSNKNAELNSTKRDLIAGEVSKDILKRKLLPKEILEAWDNNILYFHDSDYAIQDESNCCLPNIEDMLKNGTVISGRKIDSPQSFQTACTVMTQIIAQVASAQYGGQTVNGIDRILAPYLHKSYYRHLKLIKESNLDLTEEQQNNLAEALTKRELKDGVQTIQYQINTLSTSNGQTPFCSLVLYFKPDYEYAKEAAMICEEILRQRIRGIKNADGVYTTPVFPKLIYVLDEHNIHPYSPYYYLTQLSVQCTALRQYPKVA
jgi:ribonucleoside-triphosphate reductase